MALNWVWALLLLVGFVVAFVRALTGDAGVLSGVVNSLFDSAKTGFEISIGLTGIMALWLGILKVGERAGVIRIVARGVAPLFRTLFRGVPAGHTALGSIAMNFSANALGLDNAATPLGLRAMQELQDLNPRPERATDAQIMFLVLNTAGIALIPTSVIALRQTVAVQQGVQGFNAADIFLPTLLSTAISFLAGMIAVSVFQRINLFRGPVLLFAGSLAAVVAGLWLWVDGMASAGVPAEAVSARMGALGAGIILAIIAVFVSAGVVRRQPVFDHFVEGAKEGFSVAVRIIPYLVAMLAAIAVFRAAGCTDFLVGGVQRGVLALGMDARFVPALPVGIMKTLSGSGARGLMVDAMQQYGVASFEGKLAAIIQGSTETTFYVLAVYFGSVGIKHGRHALAAGLIADAVGLVGAVAVGYLFFG